MPVLFLVCVVSHHCRFEHGTDRRFTEPQPCNGPTAVAFHAMDRRPTAKMLSEMSELIWKQSLSELNKLMATAELGFECRSEPYGSHNEMTRRRTNCSVRFPAMSDSPTTVDHESPARRPSTEFDEVTSPKPEIRTLPMMWKSDACTDYQSGAPNDLHSNTTVLCMDADEPLEKESQSTQLCTKSCDSDATVLCELDDTAGSSTMGKLQISQATLKVPVKLNIATSNVLFPKGHFAEGYNMCPISGFSLDVWVSPVHCDADLTYI